MPTQGPLSPGSGISFGSNPVIWQNPSNILSSNDSYATATHTTGAATTVTNELRAFAYPFNFTGTVTGIEVGIERKHNGTGSVDQTIVNLMKNGTLVGNPETGIESWPTSDGTQVYGGSSSLWGTTWSASEINNNIGVSIIIDQAGGANNIASIDYVYMTVYGPNQTVETLPFYLAAPPFTSNNNTNLYTSGFIGSSGTVNLYIAGKSSIFSDIPLYSSGHTPYNNDLALFLHNSIQNNTLNLFIQGSQNTNVVHNFPLFIHGITVHNSNITLFVAGSISVSNDLNLFIPGFQNHTSFTPPPNPLTLYIAGPINPVNSVPLFIRGPYIVNICVCPRNLEI